MSKVVLSSIWLNAYTVNCQCSFSSKTAKQQIQTNLFSRQLHNYSIAILVMNVCCIVLISRNDTTLKRIKTIYFKLSCYIIRKIVEYMIIKIKQTEVSIFN